MLFKRKKVPLWTIVELTESGDLYIMTIEADNLGETITGNLYNRMRAIPEIRAISVFKNSGFVFRLVRTDKHSLDAFTRQTDPASFGALTSLKPLPW